MNRASGVEQLLLRPFDTLKSTHALALGLVGMLATAVLAGQAGLQTRGVLDLQFIDDGSPAWLILQGLINWLCLGLSLLLAGRWLAPQPVSALRLLAFQAAARWPLLLSVVYLSIPALGRQIHDLTQRLTAAATPSAPGQVMADAAYMLDAFVLTLLGVPLLVFLAWMVWLMFHGYQAASGLHGPQAVFSFAGALVVAWILSRILMLAVP